MAITLELRPDLETRLREQAQASGLSVGKYVERLVEELTSCATKNPATPSEMRERLMRLAKQWHSLPTLDPRIADEIVGYDDLGLPSR